MYRYKLGIIPNLAIDLVNEPLCGIATPATVLKLVTAASLSLIYLSGWLLQRRLFGRANAFLFVLPAIAFNLVTTMGYMNFLAGIAVACLVTAVAIGRERRFGHLLLLCNVAGVVIFFCHIFALGFAIIIFFGLMLRGERFRLAAIARAALRTIALFALPLVLVAFVPRGHEQFFIDFTQKPRTLPALFMAQHASLGIYGLLLLFPLYLLFRNKAVQLEPRLRISMLLLGVFILVSPSRVETAVDIDSRMLVALAYLFFAALMPCRHERITTFVLASLGTALVAFQLWSTATIWTRFSNQVDELRQASHALPANAKVFTVASSSGPALLAAPLAYSQLTSYLTIERRIFNPLEFTGIGMQPLSVTPAYAAIDSPTGQPYSPDLANRFIKPDAALAKFAREGESGFALGWPQNFDYVVFYHFGRPYNFNPALLDEVKEGSYFTIFKVKRPSVGRIRVIRPS